MSRRVSEDFALLEEFIGKYNLSKYNSTQDQLSEYKKMHKKLYAFLVFVAEFKEQHISPPSDNFLEETASDLMLSLFCTIQGMYKPAKLQLRCSMENFLKAVIIIDNPQIIFEKSVYAIFDAAEGDKHFSTSVGDFVRQNIHNEYATLCRTVHGDKNMMHPLSALSLLPDYDVNLLENISCMYVDCIENYLKILYLNYPNVLDQMHPDNKKDVLDCMSKASKAEVVNQLFG